jgi:hypothetical protein
MPDRKEVIAIEAAKWRRWRNAKQVDSLKGERRISSRAGFHGPGMARKGVTMSSRKLGWVVLGIAFSVVLVLTGCESETTAPEHSQTGQDEFVNPYDWVGEMHNRGLDYALQRIAEDPLADWDPDAIAGLVVEFVESQPEGRSLLAAGVPKTESSQLAAIVSWTVDEYYAHIESLYAQGTVSREFADYATEILDLCLRGSRKGLHQIVADINRLAVRPEEKVILFSAAAVAEHSTAYWSAWPAADALRGTQLINPIAAADVVGGICGGVSTWITTRSTGHSDWADIAGGALIGAVGASTLGFLRVG